MIPSLLFLALILIIGAYLMGHRAGIELERSRVPKVDIAARDENFLEAIRQRDMCRGYCHAAWRRIDDINVWTNWIDDSSIGRARKDLAYLKDHREDFLDLAAQWPTQVDVADRTFTFCDEIDFNRCVAQIEFEIALYVQRSRRALESDEIESADESHESDAPCDPGFAGYEMTPAEKEAQRRSFAYGNASMSNPHVTRETIDRAADAMEGR